MENGNCEHYCSGNCRRVGCNCECGEWHNHNVKPNLYTLVEKREWQEFVDLIVEPFVTAYAKK